MKKAWYGLFIGLFFLICLIPSVGMVLAGPAPAAANEIPAPRPQLVRYDGSFNTSVLSELQQYMGKGFFGRLEGVTLWDGLCAKVFHTSPNESVLIGPDGWLFYGEAARELSGAEQLTPRQIWCAARSLLLMQEYAQSQGADFLFTAVCGKYTLYPQHAPRYAEVADGSDREHLEAALAEQGVDHVNLYEPFAAQEEELYWQWDSHWNSKGAALAADAILAAAGMESDYFAGPFLEEQDHLGDLYEMLYPAGTARETDYVWQPGFTFSYLTRFHDADDIVIETECPGQTGSLLMFRDSSGRSLYPYMAQSFGRAYFSRQNNFRLDQIAPQQATLVVVEMAERTLGYLLDYPAVYPAPERPGSVLTGAEELTCALDAPEGTLEGWQKLVGAFPAGTELAVDAPIYVSAGDRVYEAIPGPAGFTAWVRADTDLESVRVYAGAGT